MKPEHRETKKSSDVSELLGEIVSLGLRGKKLEEEFNEVRDALLANKNKILGLIDGGENVETAEEILVNLFSGNLSLNDANKRIDALPKK